MKIRRPLWKTIFGIFVGICCFGVIIATIQEPKAENIITIVICGTICFLLLRKPIENEPAKNGISAKSNTPTTSSIENNNILCRTNNQPISDDEISDLIQLDYEEVQRREAESKNIKFKRTEREEELFFQFMTNHSKEISKHTKSFEDMYHLAADEQDLNKRIELLQNTITLFEKERQWFYKTVGGKLFFQDFYEHLHNSSNDDFSYIDSVKDSLDYDLYIRDDVIPKIMQMITSSGDLMQRDIYKHLPDISKSIIQQTIRRLEKDNLIVRSKKGNSYLLSLGSCPYNG